ncbi:antitoxin YezG family protein [Rossellomorea vietnamensis]|uniref:antitoxin YezG family protein n=1 Tax=Rossellomorea vietnamensis TaxID=218284 RepID=UPI001E51EB47|nr:antitoxin YezG family protein [Rossellomorea vietnamensis]MCC5803895.1 antitoxin YezG family protein [Rossellomorea vietnamensis]
MESRLNDLYRKIAETVNEMIPEQWEKFYFYAQISKDGGGTYFFYQPSINPDLNVYSLEIPFQYEVNEKEFQVNKRKLFSLSEEMREVFRSEEQELWYSFTLELERTGKLNVHFDYTNWFDTQYSFSDQMIIWRNKYLGEVPSQNDRELIEKYHNEFPNDPI